MDHELTLQSGKPNLQRYLESFRRPETHSNGGFQPLHLGLPPW